MKTSPGHSPVKTAVLRAEELRLMVHLGCSVEEQQSLQEIRVSFEIQFAEPPEACFTDSVEDTICYGKVSEEIRSLCARNRFKTIEKLAMDCLQTLETSVSSLSSQVTPPYISIRVHKVNPPVDSLLGGAIFQIESGKRPCR